MSDGAKDIVTVLRDMRTPLAVQAADEIERLRAELESARTALKEIKKATIEGRVCDDVAWFDTITTLHDYCDIQLATLKAIKP